VVKMEIGKTNMKLPTPTKTPTCICGSEMMLTTGAFGPVWVCRAHGCPEVHGAHKHTGEPLGTPADKATRQMRILAHNAFDKKWDNGEMSRSSAYNWLSHALRIPADKCHIGSFDIAMCKRVIEICK